MAKKETATAKVEAVATPAPAKKVPLCAFERNGTHLTGTFSDGTSISVETNTLPEEQRENLLMHGLEQKLRDSYSSAKGDTEFAKGSVNKVLDNLQNNKWTASRASGEGSNKSLEIVQAIANIKGADVSAVQEIYDGASDEQRNVWKAHPAIKAEILAIRAKAAFARAEKAKGDTAGGDFQL